MQPHKWRDKFRLRFAATFVIILAAACKIFNDDVVEGPQADVTPTVVASETPSPTPTITVTPTPTPTPLPPFDNISDIVGAATLSEITSTGLMFTEGPLWLPATETLLISDVSGDKIVKFTGAGYTQEPFLSPSSQANGLALRSNGHIVACEQGGLHRVVDIDPDTQTVTVIADKYPVGGQVFNSPNDVTLDPSGNIYFTDPNFGSTGPLGYNGVFRVKVADGSVTVLDTTMSKPNGLDFSPDGTKLYVSDTDLDLVRKFTMNTDGTVASQETFTTLVDSADGVKVDERGHVYVASSTSGDAASYGIKIFKPDGTYLGKIDTPMQPTNMNFGGTDGKRLFVTGYNGKVYKIDLQVKGT